MCSRFLWCNLVFFMSSSRQRNSTAPRDHLHSWVVIYPFIRVLETWSRGITWSLGHFREFPTVTERCSQHFKGALDCLSGEISTTRTHVSSLLMRWTVWTLTSQDYRNRWWEPNFPITQEIINPMLRLVTSVQENRSLTIQSRDVLHDSDIPFDLLITSPKQRES